MNMAYCLSHSEVPNDSVTIEKLKLELKKKIKSPVKYKTYEKDTLPIRRDQVLKNQGNQQSYIE